MITVQNLKRSFGSLTAVNDISFEVRQGEIVGFLGPNGAGKTTTMKIITGFLPPTAGRALVDGIDIMDDPLAVRRKIGYLPENFPLYEDMTVLEYLKYIAEIRDIPKDLRDQKIRGIARTCGIARVAGRTINELSKGYRQRVGLAQAMIHDPEILILDEPTTGLDPNQIVEIRNLIREIGRRKTVLLSTHILPEVQATCDRVLIIHEGRIVADGTPAALQAQQAGSVVVQAGFDRDYPEAEQKLSGLPGVVRVTASRSDSAPPLFLIEARPGSDVRPEIFRLATEYRWPLIELHREEVSLEDVFRKLTTN